MAGAEGGSGGRGRSDRVSPWRDANWLPGDLDSLTLFPERFKAVLLRGAREGLPRPNSKGSRMDGVERRLGQRLNDYVGPGSASHDPAFTDELRALRPDWFKTGVDDWRDRLLSRARAGLPRPRLTATELPELQMARMLSKFTGERSPKRDPGLHDELRRLRPDWFPEKADAVARDLLALARTGGEKPVRSSACPRERRMAEVLHLSRSESGRGTTLRWLAEALAVARPDWFEDETTRAKEVILAIARAGLPRPHRASTDAGERRLAQLLSAYLYRDAGGDPFVLALRKTRPDWFRGRGYVRHERQINEITSRAEDGSSPEALSRQGAPSMPEEGPHRPPSPSSGPQVQPPDTVDSPPAEGGKPTPGRKAPR